MLLILTINSLLVSCILLLYVNYIHAIPICQYALFLPAMLEPVFTQNWVMHGFSRSNTEQFADHKGSDKPHLYDFIP